MLGGLDLSPLATLKHLAPMRREFDNIAEGDVHEGDPMGHSDLIEDDLPAEGGISGDSPAPAGRA